MILPSAAAKLTPSSARTAPELLAECVDLDLWSHPLWRARQRSRSRPEQRQEAASAAQPAGKRRRAAALDARGNWKRRGTQPTAIWPCAMVPADGCVACASVAARAYSGGVIGSLLPDKSSTGRSEAAASSGPRRSRRPASARKFHRANPRSSCRDTLSRPSRGRLSRTARLPCMSGLLIRELSDSGKRRSVVEIWFASGA